MREDTVTTCLGIILALVVVAIFGSIANGWALATIWNWFIPPIFGLNGLTLWQAMGVAMVLQLFTGTNTTQKSTQETKDKSFGEVFIASLTASILTPILTVVFAYVVYQLAF